jgi:hypothetical protein
VDACSLSARWLELGLVDSAGTLLFVWIATAVLAGKIIGLVVLAAMLKDGIVFINEIK